MNGRGEQRGGQRERMRRHGVIEKKKKQAASGPGTVHGDARARTDGDKEKRSMTEEMKKARKDRRQEGKQILLVMAEKEGKMGGGVAEKKKRSMTH